MFALYFFSEVLLSNLSIFFFFFFFFVWLVREGTTTLSFNSGGLRQPNLKLRDWFLKSHFYVFMVWLYSGILKLERRIRGFSSLNIDPSGSYMSP